MAPTTLAEALAEFQANPPTLVKNRSGQVGNQRTRYADLVEVNEKVLARLSQLGVIYTTAPTLDDDGKFVLLYELEHVASTTKAGGRYPLKLSDNPQSMGSAITYARRYALLAMTGVAAEDEDDDGHGAAGNRAAQRQQRPQPAPAAQATAQRAQRPAASAPPLPGETAGGITDAQQRKLHASLRDAGKADREAGLTYIAGVIGRQITTTKDLTAAEASRVIDTLAKQEQPA